MRRHGDEAKGWILFFHSSRHCFLIAGFGVLAGRLAVSNMHKTTSPDWLSVVTKLHNYVNPKTNLPSPLIADDVYEIISKNAERLQAGPGMNVSGYN